ncbi:methyl-accepting chemotaxis protein [Natronococcus sp. JC468]|uniref:alanine-zipper protein n=1 Tax=Natronococcus sp. JC468 TaxID=1961921 RepID=UPI00143B2240|nr:alanine-zipper protein [Natronococcus sp. JC468]NKE37918.1 methyl-accepting chemotaxis protein [Natronococcus sp. JC468]
MTIGKDPSKIDAEAPDEQDIATTLGFDERVQDDLTDGDTEDSTTEIPSREQMWCVLQKQAKTIEQLESRLEDVEQEQSRGQRNRQEIASRMNELDEKVDEVTETADEAKEIAKSATSTAEQAKSIAETGETAFDREDAEALPGGVEPSSSPLDFFANCRQHNVKQRFVDEQNKQNTWRAIAVAKRWEEFATKRTDGSGVFFTRDDLREGLTAILGKRPHAQTLKRVWNSLKEIGSTDVELKRRRVGPKQDPKELLTMDIETAEGLLETRYHHLDLLEEGTVSGGITPVVTNNTAAEV